MQFPEIISIMFIFCRFSLNIFLILIEIIDNRYYINFFGTRGVRVKKITVLASGRGSNCQNIHAYLMTKKKAAVIAKIVTDNSRAGILDWAAGEGIPTEVIAPRSYENERQFAAALLKAFPEESELIVLAGYLKKIPAEVIEAYPGMIVNIHPALLPNYGGKGMYGMNVHRAVWNNGDKVSGITIHLIDNLYDHGPVVFQKEIDISACRSPEEIAETVLRLEHEFYPKIIEKLLFQSYEVSNGKFGRKEEK